MQHGAAAHGARLQGNVERAVAQPVVAKRLGPGAQRGDLGVGSGVVLRHRRIAARGQHFATAHQHRAHGHFAHCGGSARLRQGELHEMFVVVHHYQINSYNRLLNKR